MRTGRREHGRLPRGRGFQDGMGRGWPLVVVVPVVAARDPVERRVVARREVERQPAAHLKDSSVIVQTAPSVSISCHRALRTSPERVPGSIRKSEASRIPPLLGVHDHPR